MYNKHNMKKYILIGILAISFALVTVVQATELKWGFTTETGSQEVIQEVYLAKGWNLIAGLANRDWIISGDVKPAEIKAIYAYNPIPGIKKTVRVFPNPNSKDLGALPASELQTSFWVYSTKAGKITYKTLKPEPLEMTWAPGWNFIGLTSELVEGSKYPDLSLSDIKGNCIIEKAYVYTEGQWVNLLTEVPEMDSTFLNKGMVMKIASGCKLGHVSARNIPSQPPQLPN